MFAIAFAERPIFAFGAALFGCGVYFLILFGVLIYFKATVAPFLYLILWALPIVVCGVFHHTITRKAAVSQARRWLQIVASAFGAPILAFYVIGFGYVIVTGRGF